MHTILPDFDISAQGPVSQLFRNQGITAFGSATLFISNLPYGRNSDKDNPAALFYEQRGTCSTKHAALKQLADENGFQELKLMLGMFRMNAVNTPEIATTLAQYGLLYIPEAHMYLRYRNKVLDYTKKNSTSAFEHELLMEKELHPSDIHLPKIALHKQYLRTWLSNEAGVPFSFDEIWRIREQCIRDLSVR